MNIAGLLDLTYIQGLCGSAKGWFFNRWYEHYKRPVLVITKGPHEVEAWEDDLKAFGDSSVSIFPEFSDGLTLGSLESVGERWRILENPPTFLVTALSTFKHKVVPPDILSKIRLEIKGGRDNLLRWLADNGYDRTDVVDLKGEFSHRGGIVDIFPPNSELPVRVEFTGDTIESIRAFHPETQCSLKGEKVPVFIYPVSEPAVYKECKDNLTGLDEYLPKDAVIVLDECFEELNFGNRQVIRLHELITERDKPSVSIQSLDYLSIEKRSPDMLAVARERVFGELSRWLEEGFKIHVFCNNEGEKSRLEEWLREKKLSGLNPVRGRPSDDTSERATTASGRSASNGLKIGIGRISGGFVYPDEKLVVISDEEIFSRYKVRLPRRKFTPPFLEGDMFFGVERAGLKGYGMPIREFTELQQGDYVVHVDHGIGKYIGILEENNKEMIVIQYANKSRLYVPLPDAYLIERYMGLGGKPPKLNELGGKRWLKTKVKVERNLIDIAGELLEIQAKRKTLKGIVFSHDKLWQKEMEDSFIYEETPDQLAAIREVKQDMESPSPMDRLICGDVGYGKTEVSVRAAFKAVMNGKQVAVLVPTTILAQQHYRTFSGRLADYPVVVEMLSRFRSDLEQKDVIKRLVEGKVDIIIGTHRLIQPDVRFKDLGLVVIDEEQRFGVRHKEWLKRLRELVDVITMTATPIPRTLYMSLVGIRDMSTINTPPQERLSVETIISEYDEKLIRDAILRELGREGQVYFLHNRVETIDKAAERLQKLVPEAKFLVGHGQMDEELLALVMDEFVEGKADVLVCTTIIQSGLDIPNVNTIFIDRADTFGLADLYQLRGRVGRYKHQAYAYLLLSRDRILAGDAKKRLKAIQDFSHLGAGFKIAMQDLEIRGAGNILGPQQHGNIQAVGFDMYCKLLQRNILKLQGKRAEEPHDVLMDLGIEGNLPMEYMPSDRIRIDFYKRIAGVLNMEELSGIEKEMKDRFGPLPLPAMQLMDLARIKLCAAKDKMREIKVEGNKVYIQWISGKRISEDIPEDKLKWLKNRICSTIS